jgi:hypothetical protein
VVVEDGTVAATPEVEPAAAAATAAEAELVAEIDTPEAEIKAKGAYGQLKELLVADKQVKAQAAAADQVIDEQPQPASVEAAAAESEDIDELKKAAAAASASAVVQPQPQTADEIMAAAAKTAQDKAVPLCSSRMLLARSLVARQEQLYDRLATIRRQFGEMDAEVTTLRNARYAHYSLYEERQRQQAAHQSRSRLLSGRH